MRSFLAVSDKKIVYHDLVSGKSYKIEANFRKNAVYKVSDSMFVHSDGGKITMYTSPPFSNPALMMKYPLINVGRSIEKGDVNPVAAAHVNKAMNNVMNTISNSDNDRYTQLEMYDSISRCADLSSKISKKAHSKTTAFMKSFPKENKWLDTSDEPSRAVAYEPSSSGYVRD